MDFGAAPGAVEMAYVLFMDLVGYSLQTIDRQSELLTRLQEFVRQSPEYQAALSAKGLIALPTGDGMALVFMRDALSPVKCALEVAMALSGHPDIELRMGVHMGPVRRHGDIKEQVNVVGSGVNVAQRVMDFGDAGHILVSGAIAEVFDQLAEWRDCLRDLGTHEIKHGTRLHIYNLCKDGLGNPEWPQKVGKPIDRAMARRVLSRKLLVFAIGVLLALALGVIAVSRMGSSAKRPLVRSIAVLPLENSGGDPEWQYLADGMTESMINRLAQVRDLTVMSRSAVFRIKSEGTDPIEIGRRLRVDAILSGSVRHFADHLEVGVELVDSATGRHLWGEVYNQTFIDPLSFERNAAQDAVSQLRDQLGATDKQRVARDYTQNTNAYRLYLKGRYAWNKRTMQGSDQAIQFFRQALDVDPGYALAYAGIADAYSFQSGRRPPESVFPKAQAAVRKALELDPDLAEAHTSLGFIKVQYEWDWSQAEAEFRRALTLNPSYPSAHSMFGRLLTVLGRFPEAESELAQAQKLDPLSSGIANGVGLGYYLARDFAGAEKQFIANLSLERTDVTRSYLALTRVAAGRTTQAISEYENLLAADPSDVNTMADLVRAYALGGRLNDASRLYDRLLAVKDDASLLPTSLAAASAALGRTDEAFAQLQRAWTERCWYLIYLKVEPIFDPLRKDPRYKVLVRKMNLAK